MRQASLHFVHRHALYICNFTLPCLFVCLSTCVYFVHLLFSNTRQNVSKVGDLYGLTRWPLWSFTNPMWHTGNLCLHQSAVVCYREDKWGTCLGLSFSGSPSRCSPVNFPGRILAHCNCGWGSVCKQSTHTCSWRPFQMQQSTGCFTIVETKRQLLKPLSMTLFIFLFPDCHREIVNLSIY